MSYINTVFISMTSYRRDDIIIKKDMMRLWASLRPATCQTHNVPPGVVLMRSFCGTIPVHRSVLTVLIWEGFGLTKSHTGVELFEHTASFSPDAVDLLAEYLYMGDVRMINMEVDPPLAASETYLLNIGSSHGVKIVFELLLIAMKFKMDILAKYMDQLIQKHLHTIVWSWEAANSSLKVIRDNYSATALDNLFKVHYCHLNGCCRLTRSGRCIGNNPEICCQHATTYRAIRQALHSYSIPPRPM